MAQMEPLDEISVLEFEDESLVSPVALARRTHSLGATQYGSILGGLQVYSIRCMRDRAVKSLKIVVFTPKLNLLLPFGPLAILVHNMTGHHVSCPSPYWYLWQILILMVHVMIYFLKWISGLGLLSKFIGHYTIG